MQHNCVLTLTELGEQHNLPVGELECVVMHVRLILLDLPEPCHFFPNLSPGLQARKETKSMLVFDLFLECDLRAGKKAYCYSWLLDSREATVRVLLNFVVTSLSPTFAGRDATRCRL